MHDAVMTVTGPIPATDLGVTLAHEHLFIDLNCLWQAPHQSWQEGLDNSIPCLHNRGLLAMDPYVSRPNLCLDESGVAAQELQTFRDLGGCSVVDLTVHGIRPRPEALATLSRQTGVHIVAGCGFYVQRAHPPSVAGMSQDEIADFLGREVEIGIDGTGIRPGIIGELGTSSPIHPDERKVLRAAAAVQRETGLSINVHVAIWAREALSVLDILEEAGANPGRVVISHLDEALDTDYHRAVLRRGAYVEFDTFGSEFYYLSDGQREPSDSERLEALTRLLHEGWTDRLLLSQDVCIKMHLQRYGGYGYGHILRSIVPRMLRRGIDSDTIQTMLVANPARVLSPQL
ncbi:MAG: phosphotriesterase family protein [Chloroflexota bacterium]